MNPFSVRLSKGRQLAQICACDYCDIAAIDNAAQQRMTEPVHNDDDNLSNDDKLKVLKAMGMQIDPDDVTEGERRQLIDVLYKYREVFSDKIVGVRDFEYHIELKDGRLPRRQRQIYYNPPMQRIVDAELQKLENSGIIKRDEFLYSSPLLLVKKKCGCSMRLKGDKLKRGESSASLNGCTHDQNQWRTVNDFRNLNQAIVQSPFSPPSMESLTDKFRLENKPPSKYFCVLDAYQGYLQQRLSPESSKLCGIETPSASYTYNFMPMGLVASNFSFNRLTAEIIRSSKLLNCLGYVDDFIVHGDSASQTIKDLETLLQRLQYYRLRMKRSKGQYLKQERLTAWASAQTRGNMS